ncbi:MAG: hypothetical protein CSA96_06030 [Bacteroidetes bacterium]|nr:MAG: hypothetical protein CSA96_06030 [Bacteroidota bacterium]
MKFNWGTGILLFLILFLLASAAFIAFALRQEINLVHEDYYEKGVDYNEQMQVKARSAPYLNAIKAGADEAYFRIDISEELKSKLDTIAYRLYRPSNSKLDLQAWAPAADFPLGIPLSELVAGRYYLSLEWRYNGLRYEVEQAVFVP